MVPFIPFSPSSIVLVGCCVGVAELSWDGTIHGMDMVWDMGMAHEVSHVSHALRRKHKVSFTARP